jgi:peptidoglycan/LPS O-acetylase OafA/YrhL
MLVDQQKNSFDLLRLFAATLVLYSHQHALLGLVEPELFNWTTFGGVGVSIFFFLSGFLVWSSWARDPDLKRFFIRRSLRIFPALWFVVLFTTLVLGPVLSTLAVPDYFASSETWRYLSAVLLVIRRGLPGVFLDNPYPLAVNGSLWTLPVEFLCYISVAMVGCVTLVRQNWVMVFSFGLAILAAVFGSLLLGTRFVPHLEMVAFFWWGVMYGFVRARPASEQRAWAMLIGLAIVAFLLLGTRGLERTGVLILAAALVMAAQRLPWGAKVTERLGDLSYGMYIFAFPVQQIVVMIGKNHDWSFSTHLSLSFLVTGLLAYVSWHMLEKRVLLFKPQRRVLA